MTLPTPRQQAASDLTVFYDTGNPGVYSMAYTPKGSGTATTVTGIFSYGGDEENGADDHGQTGTIEARWSEVGEIIERDTFVFTPDDAAAEQTWEVVGARKSPDGLTWIIDVDKG